METPLDQWQSRLERHFEGLTQKRAGSGFPIFALEHGLSDEELEKIGAQLLSRLKAGLRLSPHWLLWVVYATERGYTYAGDEYWRSFEEITPSWELNDRNRLVPWFRKFQTSFHGVVPTGAWASHFRIIAWPITHAILPRYLQRQFARALYDLRYRLAGLSSLEPATIGRLLAAHAQASTRFEEFLEQEELTGRIVLAILGYTPKGGQEPIYRDTLSRIVADLERVRQSRDWLQETHRVVADRFKGIGRGTAPYLRRDPAQSDAHETDSLPSPSVKPSLLLRYSGEGTWAVLLDVPDFRSIAVNTDVRGFLRATRCKLNGADDTKPAGWLLSGKRQAKLSAWPDLQRPLVQFEKSHGLVNHLVAEECRLSKGPIWLFRIGQDGIAREILGRIVRPGHQYVILTNTDIPHAHPGMQAVKIDCEGVTGYRVSIPPHLTQQDIDWLNKVGLQVARTIRVWPAGFAGRSWDGEGQSEWLTTEAPCFGFAHDHPIDAYRLRLDDGEETVIEAGSVGFPCFAQIPPLRAGTHKLTVRAQQSSANTSLPATPEAEGFLILNVREPEPWTPGVSSHAGLVATLEPYDASLDAFWENRVRVSIIGPQSHRVTCHITLTKADGEEILSAQIGNALDLPVNSESWHRNFERFVRTKDNVWRYLEAAAGRFTIRADELGEYVFQLERDVLPIRWVLREEHGKITIRLIDDTGHGNEGPKCSRFELGTPDLSRAVETSEALKGFVVEQPGALFVATLPPYQDSVLVSAGTTEAGLGGLGVVPKLDAIQTGVLTTTQACQILGRWRNTRLTGFLPEIRRQQVVGAIRGAILQKLCGADWTRAEQEYLKAPKSEAASDQLVRAVHRHNGFAAVLRKDHARLNTADQATASQWYSDVAKRFEICSDPALCQFSLWMASQPERLPELCGDRLDELAKEIERNSSVLRGARLLALLCANSDASNTEKSVPRWPW